MACRLRLILALIATLTGVFPTLGASAAGAVPSPRVVAHCCLEEEADCLCCARTVAPLGGSDEGMPVGGRRGGVPNDSALPAERCPCGAPVRPSGPGAPAQVQAALHTARRPAPVRARRQFAHGPRVGISLDAAYRGLAGARRCSARGAGPPAAARALLCVWLT